MWVKKVSEVTDIIRRNENFHLERKENVSYYSSVYYSSFHGFWQSFVTIGLCNHCMRIISTYVGNTKKSEIS